MSNFKCLIADDSSFARKLIGSVINKTGGNVVAEAVDGQEAIDKFMLTFPDLVILDITMPVVDGVEVLKQIKTINKNVKVIMVSSIGHQDMISKTKDLGATNFIVKPYDLENAFNVINSTMVK